MAAYDDLNVKGIFIVGVISITVLAVTALAVQVVSYSMLQLQLSSKSEQGDYGRQNAILADQEAQISSYGVDPTTGNITIPIQQAMKLVVEEEGKRKSDEQQSDSDQS